MNVLPLPRFLAVLLAVAALGACSRDEPPPDPVPSPLAEAEAAEPALAPEVPAAVAAELPEVVVLYGMQEMIPWLESENWWGKENREIQLTVPHVIITGIHPSWKEVSAKMQVAQKKEMFYRLMLPLVMHANLMVADFRIGLERMRGEYRSDGRISDESLALLKRLAGLLPGITLEAIEALTNDHPDMEQMVDTLLYRVDFVPPALALGQAAYESGYGTSRFAVEGNSLFGQWTYKGEGLKPEQQRTESKGDYRIKAFDWPFDSVRGYFINLMTHPAYEDFRRLRAELRAAGQPFDSMVLADGLLRYSERGQDYVDALKDMIRKNGLEIADDAVFRDEPMRFLLSEQSREDVEKMQVRVEQLRETGELAEIIERMRLE